MVIGPTRPILRYHGGKWRLAPKLIEMFPSHHIYVEPFAGGCGVLLRKPRAYSEVINDLDKDVVNLFRVLRNPLQAEELERMMRLTPYARVEFTEAATRDGVDDVERARRYMVRCWMAYSGRIENTQGWRAGVTRSYTTPATDWAGLPCQVAATTLRLQGVVIEHKPAIQVIGQYDSPNTLFYCDPPYVRSTRSSLRYEGESAYTHEMNDADHTNLAKALHAAEGMVALSGYACALYDELYGEWERFDMDTMASGQQGGIVRTESLWLNPAAIRSRRNLFTETA